MQHSEVRTRTAACTEFPGVHTDKEGQVAIKNRYCGAGLITQNTLSFGFCFQPKADRSEDKTIDFNLDKCTGGGSEALVPACEDAWSARRDCGSALLPK